MSMWAKYAKKATRTRTGKPFPSEEVEEFLGEMFSAGLRTSYGALTELLIAKEIIQRTGMSSGQRGSAFAKALETSLQPAICQSGGGYNVEKVPFEVTKALRSMKVLRVDDLIEAFEEYAAGKAGEVEEDITEE